MTKCGKDHQLESLYQSIDDTIVQLFVTRASVLMAADRIRRHRPLLPKMYSGFSARRRLPRFLFRSTMAFVMAAMAIDASSWPAALVAID
jgi:hypothetical protein